MRKKILYMVAGLCTALSFSSCELDEYNPSAGGTTTIDGALTQYEKWAGLQPQCYSTLYHELYSKMDFMFVSECGTDLWLNPANTQYSGEVFYYQGLGVERAEVRKAWQQPYAVIATCNSVINKAGAINGGDQKKIDIMVAEAKVIRAFMHLTLTTYFGNITLCTTEVGGTDDAPKRNSLDEIYGSIIKDLKEAAEVLDITPLDNNYGRVTKKTALGLLARAYAQGAGEGLEEDGVSYWQRAKEVSEDMIANASSYGMYLYSDVSDLWAQDNNRNNKEALFLAAGLDAKGTDAAMAGSYFNATSQLYAYTRVDPYSSDLYKTQKNSNVYLGTHNQSGVMAPTKYAIDVFGDWDKRYENSFLTAFGQFTIEGKATESIARKSVSITSTFTRRYGISSDFQGQKIHPYAALAQTSQPGGTQTYALGIYAKGSDEIIPTKNALVVDMPLAEDENRILIYLSKNDLTAEEKAKRPYFCINMSELFDENGNYNDATYQPASMPTTYNKMFPSLIKFNNLYDGAVRQLSGEYEFRNGDIAVMRSAEVYMIAAEANVMLNNAAAAAPYLKTLRDRACRAGSTVPALDNPTEQDILDEYAREFVGEHMRWAVLKRHRANGLMKQALQLHNKKAAEAFKEEVHYNRPIPKWFLDQLKNAEEYGDNGYGYTAKKGY